MIDVIVLLVTDNINLVIYAYLEMIGTPAPTADEPHAMETEEPACHASPTVPGPQAFMVYWLSTPGVYGNGVKNLARLARLARLAMIHATSSPAPTEEKRAIKKAAYCAALYGFYSSVKSL